METVLGPVPAVVVGYDGSPGSELALDWAYEHARLEQRPLEIVHATGSNEGSLRVGEPAAASHARLLEDAVRRVGGPSDGPEVRPVLRHGGARKALLAAGRDAAALVLGATSQGALEAMILGSVAQGVTKEARCPVVIVRRSHATGLRSVLVGTDCSPLSDPAVAFAFRAAADRSCPLTVLHCLWDVTRPVGDVGLEEAGYADERRELAGSIRCHADRHPDVKVELVLSRGFADRRLVRATREHDLVVIGHHRMPLLSSVVWGSLTPVVVREAVGDVAVIPAAEPSPADAGD